MIIEQRTYTIKPLRTHDFISLYERSALALQRQYLARMIGFYTSEVGTLNQVVHLWAYDSLEDRDARRKAMQSDPGWPFYLKALQDLDIVISQESKILRPVSFSPPVPAST